MLSMTRSSIGSRAAATSASSEPNARCRSCSDASTAVRSTRGTLTASRRGGGSSTPASIDAIEGGQGERDDLGRQGDIAQVAAVGLPLAKPPGHELLERGDLVAILVAA